MSTKNTDEIENNDLLWHALNYRIATTLESEEMWQELVACVNRLIEAEREACAAECERMMMYPGGRCEAPAHKDVWVAAKAIRTISSGWQDY